MASVPETERLWLGLLQWLLFVPLLHAHLRRKVRVPRPPWQWPTRREWLLLTPLFLVYCACSYVGFRHDRLWLVTACAGVSAVFLAVYGYRDQRVVFRDEP